MWTVALALFDNMLEAGLTPSVVPETDLIAFGGKAKLAASTSTPKLGAI